jgi:hypothetical protein
MRKLSFLPLAICAFLFLGSCNKTEEFNGLAVNDYFPLQVGKYISYNIDSTVYYTNFNVSAVVKSYQIKLSVEAQITDALGRPAYRITRYIRPNASTAWAPDNTFMAVPTGNTVEFTENNLRFVKLVNPIRQDYTWQGNRYIDVTSASSTVKYYANWDYTYDSINLPAKIGALTVDSTIKVAHVDSKDAIERIFSEEKYAKGIGLVYRNFNYWNNGTPNGTYTDNSYGILMKMIDHN